MALHPHQSRKPPDSLLSALLAALGPSKTMEVIGTESFVVRNELAAWSLGKAPINRILLWYGACVPQRALTSVEFSHRPFLISQDRVSPACHSPLQPMHVRSDSFPHSANQAFADGVTSDSHKKSGGSLDHSETECSIKRDAANCMSRTFASTPSPGERK